MMFFTKPTYSPITLPDDAALDKPDQPAAGVGEVFRTQSEAVDKSRQWFSFEDNWRDVFKEHSKRIKDLTGEDMPVGTPDPTLIADRRGPILDRKIQITPEKSVDIYDEFARHQADGGTLGFKSFYRHLYEQAFRERSQYLAEKYPQHRDAIVPPALSFTSQAQQIGMDAEKAADEAWARSKGIAPYMAWIGAEIAGSFRDPVMVATMPLQMMAWAGRAAPGIRGIGEAFLKSGAVNAGVEVGMAPLRQGARKELGLDYGAGQAALDIGGAFLIGGGLDAAIRGASRTGRWAFGYEPVLDEAGKVMAYRKKLVDGRTVEVTPKVHEQAEAGDAAAIRQLAEKEGLNDPIALQALDALEADQRLAQKPSAKIHDVEHDAALAQATRHIDAPELEPVPVVREVSTTQLREITDMQADARVELKRLEADIEARLRDEAGVDTARADAKARSEAARLRTETEKARADLEQQIAARDIEIAKVRDQLMSKELQDLQDTGQFREDYIEAVIDHVPAMEMQARALQDLAKRAPGTPAEVRHVLSELLQSPDYKVPTVDIGPTPQSRGLKDKALDDPYGPDAKAQVDALMADQAQELGLAPVQRGKGKGKQAGTAAKSPDIEANNSPARQPTARELTPDPIERAANVARAVDEAVAEFQQMAGETGVALRVYADAAELPERLADEVRLREQAGGGRVAAFDDPQTNAVYVSLAALQDGEIARVAHEVTHALERLGILQRGDVALLAERAKLVGDDVLAFDRASYELDFRARGLSEDQIAARIQSEEAAHLIEARRAGRDFGREINGIIDRVLQFFERLRNKLRGYGFQTADDVIEAVLSGEMAKRKIVRDAMAQDDITAFASKPAPMMAIGNREAGIPVAARTLQSFKSDADIKAHKDYAAAKSGDRDAAARLVSDLVTPDMVKSAKEAFGTDAIYVPVSAEERAGRNKLPDALAHYYADSTGAVVDDGIIQNSRAYHTGARPLDRMLGRPMFDGPVEAGRRYVLVDDVSVMGGTLAELANHIRQGGGDVAGVITLVNASRTGIYAPTAAQIAKVEARYGQVIRQEFGIEPSGLTADEAAYLLNFRDADALRSSIAKARAERDSRLLSKAVRSSSSEDPVSGGGTDPSSNLMFAMSQDIETGQSMRRDLDALGYYSKALEAARGLKQDKGTPEQMLAQLKKAGVKDAEIAATRLNEALSGKSSITKSEIIKHLEQNRVGLKEVGYGRIPASMDQRNSAARMIYRQNYENLTVEQRSHVDEVASGGTNAKWSNYSLDPSNPTYRETVLHLPGVEADPRWFALSKQIEANGAEQRALGQAWHGADEQTRAANDKRVNQLFNEMRRLSDERDSLEREIVGQQFRSGHFPEPNIVGHMMTSLTRHEGKPVFLIDQIQSDWGQKLRDGGVRDEARFARLDTQERELRTLLRSFEKATIDAGDIVPDGFARPMKPDAVQRAKEWIAKTKGIDPEEDLGYKNPLDYVSYIVTEHQLVDAELRTARAGVAGNPLVNTTDQWTTTTLRRAIRQAIEAGADYIAIPHGDTVLSYNPGDTDGMRGFYGSRATEGIVPKNLRKLLQSIDKEAQPQKVETLTTPAGERGYKPGADSEFEPNETGFTLFPLTPTVKDKVRAEGMPMFAMARQDTPEPRPQQLDPETLAAQLADLAEPVRQALRSANQTKVARQFNFLTDATGLVSSMTEDASLRILRNEDGIISGVEYRGVPYQIGRDDIGNITGLLTAAQKEALDQQNAVTQTVADLIATNTGLAPDRAKIIADEAMGIVTQNLADPDAIRTGLVDLVQRTIDEIQGPMFAMTDDRGRMKPGAEMRKRELAADLAEIELRFQNSQGDERVKLQQQRAALLGAKALEERIDVVNSFTDAKGRHDPAKALLFIQEANPYQTAGKDLVNLRNVIERSAWEKLSEVLWNFRKGAVTGDLRRRSASMQTDMADMIRAAAGEKVENPAAKVFADAWLGVAEMLRQRFNAAGGDIPKLQGWFAPQFHDAEALLKVGRDTWISYLMQPGVLDRARMVDNLSGAPLTDSQLRQALRNVYEAVTTAGQAKLDPGEVSPGRGALYKQHAEHRFIHFKNADAYLAYNKLYGGGDVYAAMIGHVHRMSRDIAAMEILGPNPHLTWTRLKAYVQNQVMTNPSLRVPTLVSDLGERVQAFSEATGGANSLDPLMSQVDTTTTRLETLRNADRNRITKRHTSEIAKLETELADVASQIEDAMTALITEPKHHTLAGDVQSLLDDLTSIQGYGIKPAWNSISLRDPQSRTNWMMKRADAMWAMYMGTSGVPVYKGGAAFMSGARNWISSSALVFAPMATLPDHATQMAARLMTGIPVTKQLGSFVRAFGKQDRQLALSTSIGLDTVRNAFAEQAAMVDRMNAQGWTSYIADRTHALSFLSPTTSATKLAYSLDFQRYMATLMDTGYQRLGPATRRMLERHDITPADWDLIRSATPDATSGKPMLTRAAIEEAVGIDLAEKYMMMLYREGSGSTLEASARGRTFYIGETQPGTLQGEITRSIAMLKSFPTTYAINVIGRLYYEIMAGRGFAAQTVGYAAAIFVAGTMLGAVSKQLKAIGQGRDPQDMTTPKFWAQAWMQSGGAGILGDFIGSSVSRTGVGQLETAAGPVASNLFNPIIGLTAGNLWQYGQDQKTNLGREGVNLLRRNTPGAFVPWYFRLAYERQILDALQEQVDPEAYRDFARRRAYWRRTANQDFYWPPGASTPQTPVNFDRAVGR